MELTLNTGKTRGIMLIVEDNVKLAELNRNMLEEIGCVALIANTLKEARSHLKIADPDIVILDIMLPDGSGFDLMDDINSSSGTRVIFLTARREKKYIVQGLEAGGIDYIKKPYDISEFRQRVKNLLSMVCEIRKRKQPSSSAPKLTKRELTAACLAADGLSNKEIANEIYISESHVKTCLREVYRKLKIAGHKDKRQELAKILGRQSF